MNDPAVPIPVTRASWLLVLAAVVALPVTFASPFAVAALGLMVFGVLHIALELRYVVGRFSTVLHGAFAWWLVGLTTAIMLSRAGTGAAGWFGTAEIVFGFAIVALGCVVALRGPRLTVALLLVMAGVVAALIWPKLYFFGLTHLHNLVPLVFLWDWARQTGASRRQVGRFVAAQLVWAVGVPALILSGALDAVLPTAPPGWLAPLVGTGAAQLSAAAPPGATGQLAVRYLAVFAFMQTMHYVVWIGFLPLAAPGAARAFDARVPTLAGRRVWSLGLGAAVVLLAIFAVSYPLGRTVYSLIATYHVYVEFPLLVVLAVGARPGVTSRISQTQLT